MHRTTIHYYRYGAELLHVLIFKPMHLVWQLIELTILLFLYRTVHYTAIHYITLVIPDLIIYCELCKQ